MRGLTLFSGGRLFEAMLTDRIDWVGAVEIDSEIDAVASRAYGKPGLVANVCEVDPAQFGHIDYLHASPVCKRFSRANQSASESSLDIDTAQATARFIETLQPGYVSVENVREYDGSESLGIIEQALYRNGYLSDKRIVNTANYGVPQTRERLIVRAQRGKQPAALAATHRKGGDWLSLPWVSWLEAIADLVDSLPDDDFAPWQKELLPDRFDYSFLMRSANSQQERGKGYRTADEPAHTVNNSETACRAFVADSFLVNNNKNEYGTGVRSGNETRIVTTSHTGKQRAFIVDGKANAGQSSVTIRTGDKPANRLTVCTRHDSKSGFIAGRVVRITPRCAARWQTLPDWYTLPSKSGLAYTIIGNGVPSRMARHVALSLIDGAHYQI